MSISVTQEESKWQPVTIVIDDVRTANLLRFVLTEFLSGYCSSDIIYNVNLINSREDASTASEDLKSLQNLLVSICKV